MNEESDLFYIKIQEECLKNAEQFIKDAQLLRRNNSLGHAYSLAVLGLEEIARFWIIYFVYMGFFTEDSIEVVLANKDHIFKQRFAWLVFSLLIHSEFLETSKYKEDISKLFEEKKDGKISYKVYERKFNKLLKEESQICPSALKVLQLNEEIKKLNIDYKIIEKNRKKGFYVEYNISEKQIINTPDSFILDDLIFIDTVQDYSVNVRDFFIIMNKNLQRRTFITERLNFQHIAEGIRKIIDEIDGTSKNDFNY